MWYPRWMQGSQQPHYYDASSYNKYFPPRGSSYDETKIIDGLDFNRAIYTKSKPAAKDGRKRMLIISIAIIMVLIVCTAIAVALALFLPNDPEKSSSRDMDEDLSSYGYTELNRKKSTNRDMDQPETTSYLVEGTVYMQDNSRLPYVLNLAYPDSSDFANYERFFCDEVEVGGLFQGAEHSCRVLEFRSGSLIVKFLIKVTENVIMSRQQIKTRQREIASQVIDKVTDSGGRFVNIPLSAISFTDGTEDISICDIQSPCKNGAACIPDDNGRFACQCTDTHKGHYCTTERRCYDNPCQNGGSCGEQDDDTTIFACSCLEGYGGSICQKAMQCVLNNPCQNGATCISAFDGSVQSCVCDANHKGVHCERARACNSDPCENDGVCSEDLKSNSLEYECTCPNGQTGTNCEIVDSCKSKSPCVRGACLSNDEGEFVSCQCPSTHKGQYCATGRVCFNPSLCQNGAICTENEDDTTTHICSDCPEGFLGPDCQYVNECYSNGCENGGSCTQNNEGVFVSCICPDGFKGDRCATENTCITSDPCQNQGICHSNDDGSHDYCDCSATEFKGETCAIARVCSSNRCLNGGTCSEPDDEQTYICTCPAGYRGEICEEEEIPEILTYNIIGTALVLEAMSNESIASHEDTFCNEIYPSGDYLHEQATVNCIAIFTGYETEVTFRIDVSQPGMGMNETALHSYILNIRVEMAHYALDKLTDGVGDISRVPIESITFDDLLVYKVEARIVIDDKIYTANMSDPSNPEYQTLERDMCEMAKNDYEINEMKQECILLSVQPGSVVAVVQVRTVDSTMTDRNEAVNQSVNQVRNNVRTHAQNNPNYNLAEITVDYNMCAEGTYPNYPDGENNLLYCSDCPIGSYKENRANEPCRPCSNPDYTTEYSGSTSENDCNIRACAAGSRADGDTCEPCPLHTYQDQQWALTCYDCPETYVTLAIGSDSEQDCVPGLNYGINVGFVMQHVDYPYVEALVDTTSGEYIRYAAMVQDELSDILATVPGTVAVVENIIFHSENDRLDTSLSINAWQEKLVDLQDTDIPQYLEQQRFQLSARFVQILRDDEGAIQSLPFPDIRVYGIVMFELVGVMATDDDSIHAIDLCDMLRSVEPVMSYSECHLTGEFPYGSGVSMRFSVTLMQPSDDYNERQTVEDNYRAALESVGPDVEIGFMGDTCEDSDCAFSCEMHGGEPICTCQLGNVLHADGMHCNDFYLIIFPNRTTPFLVAGDTFLLRCIVMADPSISREDIELTWTTYDEFTGEQIPIISNHRTVVYDSDENSAQIIKYLGFWSLETADSKQYTCTADYHGSIIAHDVTLTVRTCSLDYYRCAATLDGESEDPLVLLSNRLTFNLQSELRCIPGNQVCDGVVDCPSMSDEYQCSDCTRENMRFQCNSGLCINITQRCDNNDDCGDASDEFDCSSDCASNEYICSLTRMCIPQTSLCDGRCDCPMSCSDENIFCPCRDSTYMHCDNGAGCYDNSEACDRRQDCEDWSDEKNCSYSCYSYQFTCDNGHCIQSFYYACNNRNDCGDWSDETDCECENDEWKCPTTGECILKTQYCDGQPDCATGDDEAQSCGESCFEDEQFSCGIDLCLNISKVCDGEIDCPNSLDERTDDCECGRTEVKCDNGLCIPEFKWCDGIADCEDMSDEPENCWLERCPPGYLECNNGVDGCVNPARVCDSVIDCTDTYEDENQCECTSTQVQCEETMVCIDDLTWCDGTDDCGNNWDESDCPSCPPNKETCGYGLNIQCYSDDETCDGRLKCPGPNEEYPDVIGWEDERDCACGWNETQCDMGLCIAKVQYCDGVVDCPDNSDEQFDCECFEDVQFQCNDGTCISRSRLCDGIRDCAFEGEDEYTRVCPCDDDEFKCLEGGYCIRDYYICNGNNDCGDWSDELGHDCVCSSNELQCDVGTCYSWYKACDGHADCPDGSDEDRTRCEDPLSACGEVGFACYTDLYNIECRSPGYLCDEYPECLGNHDEYNCSDSNYCDSPYTANCSWGGCIDRDDLCDGINDCIDFSDEINCFVECGPFEIRCDAANATGTSMRGDFYCLSAEFVCDTVTDCFNGEDEVWEGDECVNPFPNRCGDGGNPIIISDESAEGYFATPRYPGDIPANSNCTWRLQADENYAVVITIDFEGSSSYTNIIQIEDSDGRILWESSSGQSNSDVTLVSRGSRLTMHLTTRDTDYAFLVHYYQEPRETVTRPVPPTPYIPETTTTHYGTGCNNGNFTAYGGGTISSPNYPGNYGNEHGCIWYIIAQSADSQVHLEIADFETEECCDQLEIYDGDIYTSLAYISGGISTPAYYITTGPVMILYFSSDYSVVERGFIAYYNEYSGGTVGPTYGPSTQSPAPTPEVISIDGGEGLIIANETNIYGNDVILRHNIILTGADKSWVLHERPLVEGVLEEFYFYTHNSSTSDPDLGVPILLQIWRPSDNERIYRLVYQREMIKDRYSPNGIFYTVNVAADNFMVQNDDCIGWTIDRSWGVISLSYTENHRVTFRVLGAEGTVVGQEYEMDRIRLPAAFSIAAKINPVDRDSCSGICGGFTSTRSCYCDTECDEFGDCCADYAELCASIESGCGGDIIVGSQNLVGSITSPGYPTAYQNHEHCQWRIARHIDEALPQTFETQFIQLTLVYLDTENELDVLMILSESQNITFSGFYETSGTDFPVIANDSIGIIFTSDDSIRYPGFVAYYQLASQGCGSTQLELASNSQTFTSPNYPNNYPADAICSWVIKADTGYRVQIQFTELDIAPGDYFMFSNGTDTFTLQELTVDSNYTSPSSFLFITFVSNSSETAPGFAFSARQVSGPVFDCPEEGEVLHVSDYPGEIASPSFPGYNNNENCTWILDAGLGYFIHFAFDEFALGSSGGDKLTLYDGGDIHHWYGEESGAFTHSSTESRVTLTFTSDSNETDVGFHGFYYRIVSEEDKRRKRRDTSKASIGAPSKSSLARQKNLNEKRRTKRNAAGQNKDSTGKVILDKIKEKHREKTRPLQFVMEHNPYTPPDCSSGNVFSCATNTTMECVYQYQRCDGNIDCSDGSDEDYCDCNKLTEFTCANTSGSNRCPYKAQVCDGIYDCIDASDEWDCVCDENFFYCATERRCMPNEWLCDGETECLPEEGEIDGIDEADCIQCEETQFRCSHVGCIDQGQVCDGVTNCPDNSDEQYCIYTEELTESDNFIGSTPLVSNGAGEMYLICADQEFLSVADLMCRMMGHSALSEVETFAVSNLSTADVQVVDGIMSANNWESSLLHGATYSAVSDSICERVFVNLTCEPHECGTPVFGPDGELQPQTIVNGLPADIRSWPHQVSLQEYGSHFCGGSIINEYWIVTAAHCYLGYIRGLKVIAGSSRTNSYTEYTISHWINHPDYDPNGPNRENVGFFKSINDIALIRLSNPLIFNDHMRPICLPGAHHRDDSYAQCYATGWGHTDPLGNTDVPVMLRQAKVNIVPINECQQFYYDRWEELFPYARVPYNAPPEQKFHVCIGDKDDPAASVCWGDSGGPLACEDHHGRWFLHGVTSSLTILRCQKLNMYTRTQSYIDWIEETMDNTE